MKNYVVHAPIYTLLSYCNKSSAEKKILDCGAGGKYPPLALFHQHGYETYGIDISENQLKRSESFCKENNLELNISYGDMRDIKFDDESFGFVYSYNAIFHMTKKDIEKGIKEMERVLKKGGLLFVNLLSVEDMGYGQGKELEKGEFCEVYDGEEVIHTYYEDTEGEKYFTGFDIIDKRKRIIERYIEGRKYKQVFIDYIGLKK